MKKVITLIIIFFSLFITACGSTQTEEPKKIIIYFETFGGMIAEELPNEFSIGKIDLPIPEKEGYIFLHWSLEDGTIIDENYNFDKTLTIYANWAKIGKKYQIYYDLNGGSFDCEYPSEHVFGYETTLITPVKEYHKFLGWYDNKEFIGSIYQSLSALNAKHITLYAKWEDVAPYEDIIYYLDGGILPDGAPTKYIPSKVYQLVEPTKEGYYFRGFFDNSEFIGEEIKFIEKSSTGARTLYAKWVEKKLSNSTISFIGDSITTFIGYIPEGYACCYPTPGIDVLSVEDTWWYQVVKGLGATLCSNNSYSGSKVSGGAASSANNIERVKKILNQDNERPDILIIHIGTNDCSYSVSNDEFEKAYLSMINQVKEISPNTEIYLCTLIAENKSVSMRNRLEGYNEIIRNIGLNNNCKIIELAKIINYTNASIYLGDPVHPNKLGMQQMANEVIRVIKEDYE